MEKVCGWIHLTRRDGGTSTMEDRPKTTEFPSDNTQLRVTSQSPLGDSSPQGEPLTLQNEKRLRRNAASQGGYFLYPYSFQPVACLRESRKRL